MVELTPIINRQTVPIPSQLGGEVFGTVCSHPVGGQLREPWPKSDRPILASEKNSACG